MSQDFHRVSFLIPIAASDPVMDIVDELVSPASMMIGEAADRRTPPPDEVYVELLFQTPPDLTLIHLALTAAGVSPLPDLREEILAHRNWIEASLRELTEVKAGRVHIYGSHHPKPVGDGRIALKIEAGLAFGTGHHETTTACLKAMARLERKSSPRHILDVGCGTGVLAMAAARLWPAEVIASDIDPVAVLVARENAQANALLPRIHFQTAPGLKHPAIMRRGPYDLILANILARPLIRMSDSITAALMPGGRVVLSGLLLWQERWVAHAYKSHGLVFEHRQRQGNWLALTFRAP